jgi:ArsR family transcriptional regulator, cadmium/lead-responsive transcriptional repressor
MMMGKIMISTPTMTALELKAKLFRGFSDPSRLAILESLVAGARSVTEIVGETGLSQSNVSNHLSCLRDCGLVVREQRGRYILYQLSDERIVALLTLAGDVLRDVAKGVYECVNYERDNRDNN